MDAPPTGEQRAGAAAGAPHSIEAEQAVIGGLLLDNEAWDKVSDIVTENDFYSQSNRTLFRAVSGLAESGSPCDAVTVAERLKGERKDGAASADDNTLSYLADLVNETPSAANIVAYARIVHENAVRRQLLKVAAGIIEDARSMAGDSAELIDRAEQNIFRITDDRSRKMADFRPLQALGQEVFEQVEKRSKSPGLITGVATGFREFDEKTNGLQAGDLVIIAGRPSMGKTSFALNIAEHAAARAKCGAVAIFSMEMPAHQIATRFYSSLGRINQMHLRTGNLSDEEWARLTECYKSFSEVRIYVDDSPSLTPTEVRARVRRLRREHRDLALVVVDYLQLMRSHASVENRAVEISEISRSLKALAKEVNLPVVALSQLNRNIESRPERRPQMSDLRESGALEQDADLIAVLYRGGEQGEDDNTGAVDVEVVKQRNGPTFKTRLTFIGQYTRFENYFPEEAAGGAPSYPDYNDAVVSDFEQI